jgi:AraC family transcriptional regulator, regulatory protein of adaptative response / methylated-DNA-[protein]-cysteine methyltransferase
MPPTSTHVPTVIHYLTERCRFGAVVVAATERGIVAVEFAPTAAPLLKGLKARFPKTRVLEITTQRHPLRRTLATLVKYLDGSGAYPEGAIEPIGTPFQERVWQALRTTRPGQRLTYAELARRLRMRKSVRAVAAACAANRIGLLIPCHRILRTDGGLGGFRWGLPMKRWLLERESMG